MHQLQLREEPAVTFAPVEATDIEALVQIHVDAFNLDNTVRLMFKREQHIKSVRHMLEQEITDTRKILTKATDDQTGKIVAWSGWSMIDYDKYPPGDGDFKWPVTRQEQTRAGAFRSSDIDVITERSESLSSSSTATPIDEGPGPVLGKTKEGDETPTISTTLAVAIHADATRMQEQWMKGKRYLFLMTLVTDPEYQGKGIASALLKHGVEKADFDAVECWVQSSPMARTVHQSARFRSVGCLQLDLALWAPGAGKKCGWGKYRFEYMIRPVRGGSIVAR